MDKELLLEEQYKMINQFMDNKIGNKKKGKKSKRLFSMRNLLNTQRKKY